MNIHEYQAKEILKSYGLPVLNNGTAETAQEAVTIAKNLKSSVWVVKAQIHAGGRGQGGGVKLAKSIDEVYNHAENILGMTLVTNQTGPEGKKVHKVMVEEGCDINQELYFSMLIDRDSKRIAIIASSEGGMDIETVAEETPEKVVQVTIDPLTGPRNFHLLKLSKVLGMTGDLAKDFSKFVQNAYKAFLETDASLLEINPLVLTKQNQLVALDAKMSFDDNALYRQSNILGYRDLTEEDPAEIEASKHNLSYVKLDGNIGCMVNGAGLAMASMDIIKYHGGQPANFLDVGGGANFEVVNEALKIILADTNVKGILINIFGGIVKCDLIADAIVAVAKKVDLHVPVVVRLEGTNVEKGKRTLEESKLSILTASNLDEAAKKVVDVVQKEAH
jgi:succinyl-CoA synthetase beta subunit